MIPPMKRIGMNTATSDSVIDRIVKPISRLPSRAAWNGGFPISTWRTMFSSITMASSTTKPTARVSAMSERLSRLKSSRYITLKVPTTDIGSARLGMTVAETLRRKRKITITTRHSVSINVSFTSRTDARMDSERSHSVRRSTDAGSWGFSCSTSCCTASDTPTVLVPGWRCTASTMPRTPEIQLADLSFWTLSTTCATSSRRTGDPLRYDTMRRRYSLALDIWPFASSVSALNGPYSTPFGMLTLPELMASLTSSSPTSRAAIASGSRRTRTAYFMEP